MSINEVFVSYSRRDEAFVHHLVNDLEQAHVDVWIDRQDIRGGTDWHESVDQALADCRLMILVISQDSMESPHVNHEVSTFIEHDKPIVPVKWKTAEVRSELSRLHYIDFEDQHHEVAIRQLYAALQHHDVAIASDYLCEDVALPESPPLPLRLSDMIAAARQSMWISGIALDKIVQRHIDDVKERLAAGVRLRVLATHMDKALLREAAEWLGCDGMDLTFRLYESLLDLQRECAPYLESEQLQIRTMAHRPVFGYFVVDPETDNGVMTAAPYIYHLDILKARNPQLYELPPLFHLTRYSSRRTDRLWFERFWTDCEEMWDEAGDAWTIRDVKPAG